MEDYIHSKSTILIIGAVVGLAVGISSVFEFQVILGVFSFVCWIALMFGIPKANSSKVRRALFYASVSGLPTAWFAFLMVR